MRWPVLDGQRQAAAANVPASAPCCRMLPHRQGRPCPWGRSGSHVIGIHLGDLLRIHDLPRVPLRGADISLLQALKDFRNTFHKECG